MRWALTRPPRFTRWTATQSYKQFWQPDYEAGALILAARYTTSNAIHQMGKLPKSEWDAYLRWLEDYEYGLLGLPRPDLVIFLDMPPEVSQTLLSGRYEGDRGRKRISMSGIGLICCAAGTARFTRPGRWGGR